MMKNERRFSREVAVQLLFQWELQGFLTDFNKTSSGSLSNVHWDSLVGDFLSSFYHKDFSRLNTSLIIKLIRGTISAIDKIDAILNQTSEKWHISRFAAIDRAILRIACYELAIQKELDAGVIINEAIEIAKKYGGENSGAFVNGMLDAIKKKVK